MSKSTVKYIISFLVILFLIKNSNAQDSPIANELNFGIKGGASRLLLEVPSDFSSKINEFDNKFGFAIGVELSKYLTNHLEIAIDINYSVLIG